MNRGLSIALVLVFAGACLFLTAYMPFAELGALNPHAPSGVSAFLGVSAEEIAQAVQPMRELVAGLAGDLQKDQNFQYYTYAFFLCLAMTAAAVAINVVGREDSEEKTVLPLKK